MEVGRCVQVGDMKPLDRTDTTPCRAISVPASALATRPRQATAFESWVAELARIVPLDPARRPIRPGDRVGRYVIEASIGRGGMGCVFRARDAVLRRDVAIKVLASPASASPDGLLAEARAAAALSHPNIVTVFELGVHEDHSFLAMELLRGESLRQVIGRPVRVPARRALRIAIDVLAGLVAAHDAGLVHRDLKPENLFLTDDGPVKIIDFGLAVRTTGRAAGGVQRMGGTPGYLAPEIVLDGAPATAASDLYSLGVVLHELLHGQRPAVDRASGPVGGGPTPSGSTPNGLDAARALDALIARCVARNPEGRPSARDALTELERVRASEPDAGVMLDGRARSDLASSSRPSPAPREPRSSESAPTTRALASRSTVSSRPPRVSTDSFGLPPPAVISSCGRVRGWLIEPCGMLDIVTPGSVVDADVIAFITGELDLLMKHRFPGAQYTFIHDLSGASGYTTQARRRITSYGLRSIGHTARVVTCIPANSDLFRMGASAAIAMLRAAGMRIELAADLQAAMREVGATVVHGA